MRSSASRKRVYAMILVAYQEIKDAIDPELFAESRVSYRYRLLIDKIMKEEGIPISATTIWRAFKDRKNLKFEIELWKSEKSSRKITGETNS